MSEQKPRGRQRKISGQAQGAQTGRKVQTGGPVGKQDGYQARQQGQHAQQPGAQRGTQQPGGRPSSGSSGYGGIPHIPPQNSQRQSQQRPYQQHTYQHQQRPAQRPAQQSSRPASAGKTGGISLGTIIVIALVLWFVFGGRGGDNGSTNLPTQSVSQTVVTAAPVTSTGNTHSPLSSLLGGSWYQTVTTGGTSANTDSTQLNRSVASGSRDKYTVLKGSGQDTFTLMVYMCGTDLESKSGMGTKDIQEMLNATYGDAVRVILYTGGCSQWRNRTISSRYNQIWQVKDQKLVSLESNRGSASMTSPSTLSDFIQYAAKNFPATRYGLILWDHGAGSVSGYGYDEKNTHSGSMSLAGLNTALQDGGVKFDFIGYDACLMATVENALMASRYADYLIASEESEPGVGWYYSSWLTSLGKNPSMSTLDLGKEICDSFVSACAQSARGQDTTLSLVDLAEFEHTVPDALSDFSKDLSGMISGNGFKTVSDARNGAREFAASSRIDQVDLTDLAGRMGTDEGAALQRVLKSAVKYNRSSMSNAWGLSIYFPYRSTRKVTQAVSTYNQIDMDEDYAQCIRDFASMEVSGQAVSGGSASPVQSLLGTSGSSVYTSPYGSSGSGDLLTGLLSSFFGGGYESAGYGSLFSGRSITDEQMTAFLTENMLDASALVFVKDSEGQQTLQLSDQQWSLIHGVDQNMFLDDGKGYIDLGLDNLYDFDDAGRLVADAQAAWMTINSQLVAYYHENTQVAGDSWRITGYVPALLNGERVKLLLTFDNEHEDGIVTGAQYVYEDGVEVLAKSLTEIADGDEIQFLCDRFTYDNVYEASCELGAPITVSGELQVGSGWLPEPDRVRITYRFTDLYNQEYWTTPLAL